MFFPSLLLYLYEVYLILQMISFGVLKTPNYYRLVMTIFY